MSMTKPQGTMAFSSILLLLCLASCTAPTGTSGSGGGSSSPPPPAIAVNITEGAASVLLGNTVQFAATVTGTANTGVTWTLAGPGTLSSTGLYTAPAAAPNPPQVTITATSVADPAQAASLLVSIGPNAAPPVDMAPTATITFPGATALLTSGHVTVRGTAQSPVAIARVEVNGVAATSTDGFATWEVPLELPPGQNTLLVSTEDVLGHRDMAASTATLRVEAVLARPSGITVETTGQLLVTDAALGAVVRIDHPTRGTRTIVSDVFTGTGPALTTPQSIAVEATGQMLVLDNGRKAVVRIDPRSGNRTTVSDATTGRGPTLLALVGIAVEATGQMLVSGTVEGSGSAIVRIDPVSGNRTIVYSANISDATVGGPPVLFPGGAGIAVEATGQMLVVGIAQIARGSNSFEGHTALIRIDPVSGHSTIVSDTTTGQGPGFSGSHIALEPSGQLLVLGDANVRGTVLRVDPRTGDRTVVSDRTTGQGAAFSFGPLGGIAVAPTGQAFVVDGGRLAVLRIEPTTGDRTIVTEAASAIGSGPPLNGAPHNIAIETTGQFLMAVPRNALTGSGPGALLRIDPNTGNRTIVSDATTGNGPPIDFANNIAIEATGQFLVSSGGRLLRVDPRTGDRTLVYDAWTDLSLPSLSRLLHISGLALEATGQVLIAQSWIGDNLPPGLDRVDPVSGQLSPIIFFLCGSPMGPLGPGDPAIVIETGGQIVVPCPGAVIRVDPHSGKLTAVSNEHTGSGPRLVTPFGITLEAATGQLFVTDSRGAHFEPDSGLLGAVVRIDPTSGDRTMVSDATTGSGPLFIAPRAIGLEASGELIVFDDKLGALLRVDTRSGDRAIIAK